MPAAEWYKDWFNSPYYHKLYFERDEGEAAAFIARLLQRLQPAPGSRMLDVACGRGGHSKMLAAQGYEVTGIDLSADSIIAAKEAEGERLQFFVHDMKLPFWINYFDYAFNFFTSFGYFNTGREHDDAVRTIVQSLKPGGTLLFDYLNVHYAEEHMVHNDTKVVGDITYEIHRWHNESHFYKRIIIHDPAAEGLKEYTEKVAKFSLGDFTVMLAFQKAQVMDVYGDYGLNSYDIRKTPRMIIVARK